MTLVFILLTMGVLGLVAAVAVGRIGGGLDAPASSLPSRGLPPTDAVTAQDLDDLRFSPALRGYRMDEVDVVVDRLAAELGRRDEEIERLQALVAQYLPYDPDAAYPDGYPPGGHSVFAQQDGDDIPTQTIQRPAAGYPADAAALPDASYDDHGYVDDGAAYQDDDGSYQVEPSYRGEHQSWTDPGTR